MISSSRLAELQHVPPAWKFCAVQSQERFDRENAQRANRRKWKTTARPQKHCPAARIEATKETSAGGAEPGPPARTERKWKCSEAPFMGLRGYCGLPSCICNSRRLSFCLAAPVADGGHVLRPTRESSSPRRCPRRSRTRPSIRTWIRAAKQIYKLAGNTELKRKLSERALTQRKACAREEPSPGPPFKDGRRTTGPPAPRRGPRRVHGSAAAKRARPRKRANLARGKICDFSPELGFEQRNRFRSLRDTRRTEKKALRKPPAARPVVGQTFKYIY